MAQIGVAYADTPEGRAAAAAGFALARRTGASVRLISVVDDMAAAGAYAVPGWTPPPMVPREELEQRARTAAERIAAEVGAGIAVDVDVRHGAVAAELAGASRSVDLLVCGSRGYGGLRSAMAGGVSRSLAHAAACPLLLVPRRISPEEAAAWPAREMMSSR
jgi:nucleotide-binding universal stress UspA family protein